MKKASTPLINRISILNFDQRLKKLIQDSSWLFSANIVTSLIGFFQVIIIARFLGVNGYGILVLITVYVGIANQFVDFRVWETITKYLSEFWIKGDKKRSLATVKFCYLIDISTGILAFFIVIYSAPFIAKHIIHHPETESLISLYAMSLLFSTANGTSTAILRVFDRFSWLSVFSIFSSGLKLTFVSFFLFAGYGLKGVLIAYLSTEFIAGVLLTALALKVIRVTIGKVGGSEITLLRSKLKEMGWFLFNTNINAFLGLITKSADVIFLGYFRNPIEVGFYKMAKNFTGLLGKVNDPFYTAIYPELSKMWAKNLMKEFNDFIKKVTYLMSLIIFPIALAIFFFAPFLIRLIVGEAFLPSVPAIRILIWGLVIAGIFLWSRPALLAKGRADIPTKTNVVVAICQIIGSIILVPLWGYYGSALILTFLYLIGHIINVAAFLKLGAVKSESWSLENGKLY